MRSPPWRARFRRRVLGLACLVLASATACVFDRITLPPGAPTLVVHGILDPGTGDQVVLVEQATGAAPVSTRQPWDSLDPIGTTGGVAVSGARVVITRVGGDSVVLREDRDVRADGRGAGVYRFRNVAAPIPGDPVSALLVEPGADYSLEVRVADRVVQGHTRVPRAPGVIGASTPQPFVRDRDSLFIGWPAVNDAARYLVQVQAPAGDELVFVDSLEYLVSGSLSSTRAAGRPRVFWPGFRQVIVVSAVDANVHDYYRSGTSTFDTRGLLVRLSGGLGVFGSRVRLRERVVDVLGESGAAPAGRWERLTGPTSLPAALRLWRESDAFGATRLTGDVVPPELSSPRRGVVVTQQGNRGEVVVLVGQSLRDTLLVLDGTFELQATPARFTGMVRRGVNAGVAVQYRVLP